uniref:Uncharacterized protein n=1 Tax=Ditylenchus dipsaci TaxID=166011 RepID=A0A915CYJ4_9BILA
MNIYLFHHQDFQKLYNCSKIKIDDFAVASRTHVGKSVFTLLLTSVLFILYIPCTFAVYKHRAHSCYKLMFYIAINDLCILIFIGFLHGYLGIIGAVYCSFPNFNYLCGICVNTLWMAESSAEIFLAINRCMVTLAPTRAYFWLAVSTCYGLYVFMFTNPSLFTGVYYFWSFNPFVGYLKDPKGVLFIQIFIIGFIHFGACSIHTLSKYFILNRNVLYLGQYFWFFAHGSPPVIYLTMNENIRTDCLEGLIEFLKARFPSWFKVFTKVFAPIKLLLLTHGTYRKFDCIYCKSSINQPPYPQF